MPKSDIDRKLESAREGAQPKLRGTVVSENDDSVVLKASDAIIEIPVRSITQRLEKQGGEIEVILAEDAEIVVGTVVSVKNGFVGDDVFGPLTPGLLAGNCNCNCNCSSISETVSSEEKSQLRSPFVGGGARTKRGE